MGNKDSLWQFCNVSIPNTEATPCNGVYPLRDHKHFSDKKRKNERENILLTDFTFYSLLGKNTFDCDTVSVSYIKHWRIWVEVLFKNSFSPLALKYWFSQVKRKKCDKKKTVAHTQSIPLRRWIPINGPRGNVLWIYSSTSLLIFSDHFRKACGWRFCSSTGKLAGAPLKARTGCFEGGNLVQKRRWTF